MVPLNFKYVVNILHRQWANTIDLTSPTKKIWEEPKISETTFLRW